MFEIKCVLFDIGGVLVDWHMSWITSEVSKRFDIDENLISDGFSKYLHELDSGKIEEKEFWNKVAIYSNSSSLKENTESLWDIYFRKNARINHNVIDLSKIVGAKYTTGIISNIEKVTHNVVDDWRILDNFEYKFMSYEIGFSKPDSRIYQHVINKLPFDPENMLFIDDKQANVDAAVDSGLQAIHFISYDKLKKSLSVYGMDV